MLSLRVPLARQGLIFILPCLLLTGLAFSFRLWPAGILFSVISLGLIFFFRDPERKINANPACLLSPADGRIIEIKREASKVKVNIFLSLLDVHLVRSPAAGVVIKVDTKAGKTLPAYRREASEQNRFKILSLQNQGQTIDLRMIVGVAARRIFCFVRPGEEVSAGQRVGLMAFGSRVEISFPPDYLLKINQRQKVKGGLTVLAERKQL